MSIDNDKVLHELILENINNFTKELDTWYFFQIISIKLNRFYTNKINNWQLFALSLTEPIK